MREYYIHSVFILLSVILVFSTLYLPKTFYGQNDFSNVKCGFPLEFFVYSSAVSPPLPWSAGCLYGTPQGAPKQFLWLSFFIDLGIVYLILFSLLKIYKLIRHKKIKFI